MRPPGDALAVLQQAVVDGRSVEIDYYSYGRDAQGVRRVDPWRVQAEQGQWYLEAWCHRSEAERVFRVDRIRSVTRARRHLRTARAASSPLEVFRPDAERPPRRARPGPVGAPGWWASTRSRRSRSASDGGLRVTLAIAARPWLERLLLRLGPDATVVDAPDGAGRDAGPAAARRVLDRYGG